MQVRKISGWSRLGPVLLLADFFALAQSSQSGGITGVVKDPSGAVVRGATVEVYNGETGVMERRVTTGADGLYAAPLLRPWPYRGLHSFAASRLTAGAENGRSSADGWLFPMQG